MHRFSTLKIPENGVDPLVRRLFEEMNAQQCAIVDMVERSGTSRSTIHSWRTRYNPGIRDLRACFNVLGKQIVLRNDDPLVRAITEKIHER